MAKLEVSVGIKNAAFKAGLDEMRSGAAKFKQDLSGMFAGAIGFAGIVTAIRNTVQYADTVADLGQRFDVSTDSIQRFGQAAEQNGSSLESMASAFNKLEIARSKALQGDDQMIASFAELGVTVKDLQTLGMEDLMLKIGSGSMEAAQMVQVLGKSSLELRIALKGLADGSIELADAMGEKTVQGLGELADKSNEIKNKLTVVFGGFLLWLIKRFEDASAGATAFFAMMMVNAKTTATVLKQVFTGDFAGIEKTIEAWKSELATLGEALGQYGNRDRDKTENKSKRAPRDFEGLDEENKAATKREEHLQKIRDIEAAMARDALEGQEKINALVRERERLQGIALEKGHSEEGLDAMEKALGIEQDIARERDRMAQEQKRVDKEVADEKEKAAKEETERQERIASARADEQQAREDDEISTLTGQDKIKALQAKKDRMDQEAADLELSDPEAAARKRTEIIGVDAQIRDERNSLGEQDKKKIEERADKAKQDQDNAANAKRAAASIPADSLGAVGGGRGNTNGGDAVLRAAERAVNIQQQILSILQNGNGKTERRDPSVWQ